MRIYFDNASTTKIDREVIEAMNYIHENFYGNPSSIHHHGREAKVLLEECRQSISDILQCHSSEIFFTSGGTESNNWLLQQSVFNNNTKTIISSRLEHKSILNTLDFLSKKYGIEVIYISNDEKGRLDLSQLENTLKENSNSLVTFAHANSEIGNMIDIQYIGDLCSHYNSILHVDTAQTVGHYKFDLFNTKIDSCIGAAHKFHGPKGIGFLYVKEHLGLFPLIHGGSQELGKRGGTENLASIYGMKTALARSYNSFDSDSAHISQLKNHLIQSINTNFPNIEFNGLSDDMQASLYTIINLSIDTPKPLDMVLLGLDIKGISVSTGSACSSGANSSSHVISALSRDDKPYLRISFSKYNSIEEIDYFLEVLKNII